MKFRFIGIFLAIVIFYNFLSADAAALQVSANSAVLMCADTGHILYAHNEHAKASMASTTKILTALLAIENLPMESMLTVGNEVMNVDGTSLGLKPGDRIEVYDLLVGLMLSSGNDAANAVAVAVSGSIDAFVSLMNQRAESIGMLDSSFATPSGLDGEMHYSTAYDMALLSRAAMQNDIFAEIVSKYNATIYISGRKIWLRNHNKLLLTYDGATGIKTGFTKKSGRCLVSSANRNGIHLIAVTMNASDDWHDHRNMLDYGFSVAQLYPLFDNMPSYAVDVVGGDSDKVICVPAEPIYYSSDKKLDDITFSVALSSFLYAPVHKGDIAGKLYCYHDGILIKSIPLCIQSDVTNSGNPLVKENKWDSLLKLINGWFSNG